MIADLETGMKVCSRKTCRRELPLSSFGRSRSSKDGYQNYCVKCTREVGRQRHTDNREHENAERKARYHEVTREAEMEACREWHAGHREEHNAQMAEYREQNREALREAKRARYAANPEKYREVSSQSSKKIYWNDPEKARKKRRDRFHRVKRGMDENSIEYMNNVLRNDPCAYCGSTDEKVVIDHIEPTVHGGDSSWLNLTAACGACNLKKRDIKLLFFLVKPVSNVTNKE